MFSCNSNYNAQVYKKFIPEMLKNCYSPFSCLEKPTISKILLA